ncbi:MAG: bifunctional folylpolyglutamate synthase/dihydrofolate synthase [Candidatus Deferrimicrobiota bacterium]
MTRGKTPGSPETIQPGLERILAAFEMSDHPEKTFRTLHIAGTNGKGSTACFLASILMRLRAGSVGLYTSPHLVSPEERIRVDGEKIPGDALRRALRKASGFSRSLAAKQPGPLSFFEEMTWAACDWFRRRSAGTVVMEAGLGGRWDATNACLPDVSVITTVGIDHREWLGNTLPEIAAEKAGIFRPGIPVILGRLKAPARGVAVRKARELGAPIWEMGRDFGWEECGDGSIRIRLPGVSLPSNRLGMRGKFQRDNAAVACAAAWMWASTRGTSAEAFIRAASAGLAGARCPGRFSPLPGRRNSGTWVDGAHNPDAAKVLARELAAFKSGGRAARIIALWSMLRDKDAAGFLRELTRAVDGWVAFPMEHERAATLAELTVACENGKKVFLAADSFSTGWDAARRWAGAGGMVIVCGSLAAVGEAFRHRVVWVP